MPRESVSCGAKSSSETIQLSIVPGIGYETSTMPAWLPSGGSLACIASLYGRATPRAVTRYPDNLLPDPLSTGKPNLTLTGLSVVFLKR